MRSEAELSPQHIRKIQDYSQERIRGNQVAEEASRVTFVPDDIRSHRILDRLRFLLGKMPVINGRDHHEPSSTDAGGSYLTEDARARAKNLRPGK